MILPSDEDSRKPDDPDDALPWEGGDPADEPPGFFGDDEPGAGGESGQIQSPAPPGWREELKTALFEAIDDLETIEDPAEDFDPPEPPDLFTFYGELVAMRNDLRRGAKRSTEALQQLAAAAKATPPAACMALVHLFDSLTASKSDALGTLESALHEAGIQRIVTRDAKFDAATMTTEDTWSEGSRVSSELAAGFLWNGQVLRPSRVTLR